MARWMCLVVGVGLVAACNSVQSETPDAAVDASAPDASSPPDAPPTQSLPSGSILAVHRVLDFRTGGGEIAGTLENANPRVLFLASASARRNTTGALGVAILIDGTQVATLESLTNESDSPKALSRNVFVVDPLPPGKHTVSVLAEPGTTLGGNDFVDITAVELGADASFVPLFKNKEGDMGGSRLFTADLPTRGGTGILFVAGTGFGAVAGSTIGLSVLLDDAPVGQVLTYSNEASSHKAFVPAHFVLTPSAGSHRLAIQPTPLDGDNRAIVNQHDRLNVFWLELGADAVATSVLATRGMLPRVGTLTPRGGRVLFIASGSGYRRADTPTGIGGHVVAGDTVIARGLVHTAEILSHKAFVSSAAVVDLPGGAEQEVRVVAASSTTASDSNDYFNVTAIELGP